MSSSRWRKSPSHGKCSRKYCGSSLNYGHSHHQRQRETFDGHAFKSTTGGVRPNARENGQISPPTTVRAARRASSRPHLAAVLREGRKSANIQAGSGVIWRNPDKVAWSGPRAPIERRWRIQKSDEKAL